MVETEDAPASIGTAERLRVLICENDPLLLTSLRDLINDSPGLEVVGAAVDAQDGAAQARLHRPDVVLLDVRMPEGGGTRAARLIRQELPAARLIAFSAHADRASVLSMLRAGASEYLIKGADTAFLVDAVRRRGRGRIGLSHEQLELLVFEMVDMLEQAEGELHEARARPPDPGAGSDGAGGWTP